MFESWEEKELYFKNALDSCVIVPDINTIGVRNLCSALDRLNVEASFELADLKRKDSSSSIDLKNAEAEWFSLYKREALTQDPKTKVATADDIKGNVVSYLRRNKLSGYNSDIYTVRKAIIYRLTFMEQVCKIIKERRETLVTIGSMLKIESEYSWAQEREKKSNNSNNNNAYAYNY